MPDEHSLPTMTKDLAMNLKALMLDE